MENVRAYLYLDLPTRTDTPIQSEGKLKKIFQTSISNIRVS